MVELEVPVFESNDVVQATSNGVSRLELNAPNSYPLGGTTPTVSALRDAKSCVPPATCIRVMIRPRGPPLAPASDFVYSGAEFEAMKNAITLFKESSYLDASTGDGFVFGILTYSADKDNLLVDVDRNAQLVNLARPFRCVFHRAFDDVIGSNEATSDAWREALHAVQHCGFDGILTSGGPGNADNNGIMLARIVAEATELGIEIIIGGGVRSHSVKELLAVVAPACHAKPRLCLHSSCRDMSSAGTADFSAGEAEAILRELMSDVRLRSPIEADRVPYQ